MAINITHRPDLDERVERLAAQLRLAGYGRKTAVFEKALEALEEQVGRYPNRAEIKASLDRYLKNGPRLRKAILREHPHLKEPLSQTLPDELYDERGIPK